MKMSKSNPLERSRINLTGACVRVGVRVWVCVGVCVGVGVCGCGHLYPCTHVPPLASVSPTDTADAVRKKILRAKTDSETGIWYIRGLVGRSVGWLVGWSVGR